MKGELKKEWDSATDETKKTRYILNPNYVYERPGWLNQQ